MKTSPSIFRFPDLSIWLILIAYTAMISLISLYHEVWRDEVVLINILRDSSSLWDFYAKTQGYGHPRLWHTLLYLSWQIFPCYPVITILNTAICVGGMLVFLKFSPFRMWQKMLFALGLLPIYIYPAFNRSYGLCMLLIFILAVFYKDRWKHIIPVSLTLILLANTHAHTLIVAIAIASVLALEYLWSPQHRTLKNAAALIFVLAGIILGILQIMPEPTSTMTTLHVGGSAVIKAFLTSIIFPGKVFDKTFGIPGALFSTIIIYAIALVLWNKRHLFLAYIFSIIGLFMFTDLFYPSGAPRHQGFVFLIFIWMMWVERYENPSAKTESFLLSSLGKHLKNYKNILVTFLLILQIYAAWPMVRKDILNEYSSAKSLNAFLKEHPELTHAVFLPEPDYLFETMPYYIPDISMYLARESVFQQYVRFTTDSRMSLRLDELLAAGEAVRADKNAPIVFVVGHSLSEDGPYVIDSVYDKTFSFSKESLADFKNKTRLIASFRDAIGDENYDLYILKNP